MYLKRLELLGFKSFATKTVLDLDPGMTALVGPNGSGKSNVVDAVRWALGEQSLRAVRSRKSEEVIFAGNGRRAPVGMAEVTLVFDNSQGVLPLPFGEVSVSRRLFRSGEGEYVINRSRARLRDVVELLTHASLGPGAYSIVGQGAVDEVLLQRPEERRGLIEAAADISRNQLKLKESLEKLAETEGNIRRVEDIRSEIAPRLSKLRAQANRARRHEQLTAQLEGFLRWRHLLQARHLRERVGAALEVEQSRAQSVRNAANAQDAAWQRLLALREGLREDESRLDAERKRLDALVRERERHEREAALLEERKASLRRQLADVERELARARVERSEIADQVQRLASGRAALVSRNTDLSKELAQAENEGRQAQSGLRMIQGELDRSLGDLQTAARRKTELEERRHGLLRDSRRAAEVQAESRKAAEEAAARLGAFESQLAAGEDASTRLRHEISEVERRLQHIQSQLHDAAREIEVARRQEREAWERDSEIRHRIGVLRALKDRHGGLLPGAQDILESGLAGIRGVLASAIQVPPQYVRAVSAALGGAQAYVVSDGFGEGLDALRSLGATSGRITIAPMRLETGTRAQSVVAEFRALLDGLLDGVAFRGVACDLVSCEPIARELCARYLGLSLVVDGLDDAVKLYQRLVGAADGRLAFQVVTLDGQVLRARGDLVSPDGAVDSGLVARETELRELVGSGEDATAALMSARARVAELETAQAELSRNAAEGGAEVSRLQADLSRQAAARAELAAQLAKVEAAIEWHRSRCSAAEQEAVQSQESQARTERELADVSARELGQRGKAEQLRSDLGDQRNRVADSSSRVSALQQEAASERGKLRELEARVSALSEALERATGMVARQEDRQRQLAESLAGLSKEENQDEHALSVQGLEDTEKLVSQTAHQVDRLKAECESAESERARLLDAQESAREELTQAEARLQRAAAELSSLLAEVGGGTDMTLLESETPEKLIELADRFVLDAGVIGDDGMFSVRAVDVPNGRDRGNGADHLEAFEAVTPDRAAVLQPPEDLSELSERVEALRREIAALGTINAEAPEEYRIVSERHAFLTSQVNDLHRAERTLRKAMEELRDSMQSRFQETFELVNAEFARSFSTLFGGGSARLAMTQPDQPLDGGVEVIVSLPGRKSGNLLGLSGGERSLTAVALLFALMKINPSPFCVLDEVDAALDESNVHRFCSMVRGLAVRTQFLLITHNRTTMEMASALHGVSMASDSTSKVVSLKLASGGIPN